MTSDVIFLFVSKSGGHARAAEAVAKEIHALRPDLKTSSFDSSYFHPVFSPIISKIYIELITKTPEIWNYVYDNKKLKDATREIRDLFNLINFRKLEKLIESCNPGVIVCTHALPANIISYWKSRARQKTRSVSIITDYGIHSYWVNRETDLYFVPEDSLAGKLREYGVPAARICVSGIPVDRSFLKKRDKKSARAYFGLNPDAFTVLVMGGNGGIGPYDEIIGGINSLHRKPQMLVATGKNSMLYAKLKLKFRNHRNVRFFKYIKNMPAAMDSADALVTKPGGLTITEAITKELPMVVINSVYGQELRNTDFLMRHRLAMRCNGADEVPRAVETLMTDRNLLEKFRTRLANTARRDSAALCAEEIVRMAGNGR